MNIFSLTSLVSGLILFAFAGLVLYGNRASAVNRIFAHACITASALALAGSLSEAEPVDHALFWHSIAALWPLVSLFLFHFILVFTRAQLLHRRAILWSGYAAMLLLCAGNVWLRSQDLPQRDAGGYRFHTPADLWPAMYAMLAVGVLLGVLPLLLACLYTARQRQAKRRRQLSVLCVALALPAMAMLATSLLPGTIIFPLNGAAMVLLAMVMERLVLRMPVFAASTATAADNIITRMSDFLFITDARGNILSVNPAVTHSFGFHQDELVGTSLRALADARTPLPEMGGAHDAAVSREVLLRTRAGRSLWVSLSESLLYDKDNELAGMAYVGRDITNMRKMNEQIAYQATHDFITGLMNRQKFEAELAAFCASTRQQHLEHVLLYMDLDKLKVINDTCGHPAGDQLLRQLAVLLDKHLRSTDLLSRLGGDEFAILLCNCGLENGMGIANEICRLVEQFRFAWDGKAFAISVSIGAVLIDETLEEMDAALKLADGACTIAKQQGGNRVHVHRQDDAAWLSRHMEKQLLPRLQQALAEGNFQLFCQPILSVADGENPRRCHELLLRLVDEHGQLLLPSAFLPLADRYHLCADIDRWVITHCCAFYHRHAEELAQHTFHLNLSAATLNDNAFTDFLARTLTEYAIPPDTLCFEIPETAAIANLGSVIDLLDAVGPLGCRVILDDFGVSLSSFNYLKHLQVDGIKIDGAFIADICENAVDCAMVKCISEIGHLMGFPVMANYVETEAIYQTLHTLGVDAAQGNWLGKPEPLESLVSAGLKVA